MNKQYEQTNGKLSIVCHHETNKWKAIHCLSSIIVCHDTTLNSIIARICCLEKDGSPLLFVHIQKLGGFFMLQLNYFYGDEADFFRFYQIPEVVVKYDVYRDLPDGAKLLYGFLISRTSLSAKNNWRDSLGRVYVIYSIKSIMEDLNCGNQKAVRMLQKLKEVGLVEVVRRGLTKTNLIYVKNFATPIMSYPQPLKPSNALDSLINEIHTTLTTPESTLNCDFHTQENLKITPTQLLKSQTNNIDFNDLDLNQSEGEAEPPEQPTLPPSVSVQTYGEFKHVQLTDAEYANLIKEFGEALITEYITRMDLSLENSGKTYKSYYASLKHWIIKDGRNPKNAPKPAAPEKRRNRFANFKGRERDYAELERLEFEHHLRTYNEDIGITTGKIGKTGKT